MGIARVVAEIRKAAKHKFFEGVRRTLIDVPSPHVSRVFLSVNEHQVQYKTCVGTC